MIITAHNVSSTVLYIISAMIKKFCKHMKAINNKDIDDKYKDKNSQDYISNEFKKKRRRRRNID